MDKSKKTRDRNRSKKTMRTNSECLLVVLMLCVEMAALCSGEEQKRRQQLPTEQELPAPTKLSDDHVEMLLQMSEKHHYNDDDDVEEEEEAANSSGFGRQLQSWQDMTSWYFTADFELHFYRKNGPRCLDRHHDKIVSMMMDGLDEVVGRSRYARRISAVSSDHQRVCREEDGAVTLEARPLGAAVVETKEDENNRMRLLNQKRTLLRKSAGGAPSQDPDAHNDDDDGDDDDDDDDATRNLQLRASYFLHNFHSGAYRCRLCNSEVGDNRIFPTSSPSPTPAPVSPDRDTRLDALSVDASAHLTSALELSNIGCLRRKRSSVRVKLTMVDRQEIGNNGCTN